MTFWRIGMALAALLCTVAVQGQSAGKAPAWTYEGATGPAHWGDLSPAYSACKAGRQQSPIDIRQPVKAALPPIGFDYRPSPLKLVNTGHTVQANYAAGSSITIGGERYALQQLHFHRPSEEKINGRGADMVLHLVHSDSRGEIAVVSVLLQKGEANAAIQKIWDAIPQQAGQTREVQGAELDASALLPASRGYYSYQGSLTTPPCTEGVTWLILKTPMSVSAAQIHTFETRFHANARPLQPSGSRPVRESE